MNSKKATIYDYARMCRANLHKCENCPMWDYKCSISAMDVKDADKANEIILKWCKEHPVETRQDRFLKMFPNAEMLDGRLKLCPEELGCVEENEMCSMYSCDECRQKYWLAEVDE